VESDDRRALEVLRLVDRLDNLIHEAKVVPLTSLVRIERGAAFALLDELRTAVAELVNQGKPGF
jgi:hypothetical protein